MRRSMLLGLLMGSAAVAAAQGRPQMPYAIYLEGRVLGATDGERVPGTAVEVKYDGSIVETLKPDRKGRFEVELKGCHYVEVAFTAPGQVQKHVVVDTRSVPPLLDVPEVVLSVQVTLFEPMAGAGMEIFDQPLGKAAYKHSVRNIIWDPRYAKEMRDRIRRFVAKYDAQVEKHDAIANR